MYILTIALRHLRTRSICWVAMSLIAVNVVLYLLIISVLEGFKEHYMDKLQSIHAHITVSVDSLSWGIEKPDEWAAAVAKADPGIRGVTIGLESPALAIFDSARTVGTLRGVDLERELKIGRLKELLQPPELRETLHEFGRHERHGKEMAGCIVGGAWRTAHHLHVGDQVTFLFSDENENARSQPFYILGFYEGKNPFLEMGAYVDRKYLAKLLDVEGTARTLLIWLDDPNRPDLKEVQDKVRDIMTGILQRHNPGHVKLLEVESWQDKENSFYRALTSENRMMRIILCMSLLLLGFIMFLIFGRLVSEKVRDIGALRALGATPAGVRHCFLAQAVLISLFGLALGLICAYFLIRNVNPAVDFIANVFKIDLFPSDVGPNRVPTHTLPLDLLTICALTIVSSWLGALLPAWRASRMSPVECLRHE